MVKRFFAFVFAVSFLLPLLKGEARAQESSFFIEIVSLPQKVYLGEAFEVKVRMLNNLPVYSLYALPINWDNVDVYPQENPRVYTMRRNGIPYAVSEILLKMVIKSVGVQKFAQLCFEAVVPDHIISGEPNFGTEFLPTPQEAFKNVIFSQKTNTVVACTSSFSMESLPLPAVEGTHIFPAFDVSLKEGIQPQTNEIFVGKPVKRSIILQAKGTASAFLPDFEQKEMPDVKLYSGKLEHQMITKEDGVTAIVRKTVVFVPQKEGILTLPAVEAVWFNPKSGRLEKSVLPEHKIRVLKQQKTVEIETMDAVQETPDAENLKKGLDSLNKYLKKISNLFFSKTTSFILFVLLGGGMFLFFLFFFLSPVLLKRLQERKNISKIHRACLSDQPDLIEKALICWAKDKFPHQQILTLFDVILLFDDADMDLRVCLDDLKYRIYGIGRLAKTAKIQKRKIGSEIWKAFQKSSFAPEQNKDKDTLFPELYPDM